MRCRFLVELSSSGEGLFGLTWRGRRISGRHQSRATPLQMWCGALQRPMASAAIDKSAHCTYSVPLPDATGVTPGRRSAGERRWGRRASAQLVGVLLCLLIGA